MVAANGRYIKLFQHIVRINPDSNFGLPFYQDIRVHALKWGLKMQSSLVIRTSILDHSFESVRF